MASPIPIWWDPELNSGAGGQTLSWNVGTVDADSYGPVNTLSGGQIEGKEFYIWNNKGGSTVVSDMTNVFITTKDIDGNDGPPVADRSKAVVEVKVHDGTSYPAEWKEIGGSNTSYIADILNMAGFKQTGETKANTLSGASNDGNALTETSKKNYSRVRLRLHVKPEAPAGPMSWKTRVSYQFT